MQVVALNLMDQASRQYKHKHRIPIFTGAWAPCEITVLVKFKLPFMDSVGRPRRLELLFAIALCTYFENMFSINHTN